MAKKPSFDLDEAKARRELERASKRLYANAEGVLLDEKDHLYDVIMSRAPDGPTGKLRANVYVEVGRNKKGPVLRAGVRDLPYAVYVEFGTKYAKAQPFIRPSLAEMPGFISRRRGRR